MATIKCIQSSFFLHKQQHTELSNLVLVIPVAYGRSSLKEVITSIIRRSIFESVIPKGVVAMLSVYHVGR